MANLKELEKTATPGKWGQFHPNYMPEAKGEHIYEFDSSHEVSVVTDDGKRKRLAKFKHAADAALAEALVNAFREGRLIEIDHDCVSLLREFHQWHQQEDVYIDFGEAGKFSVANCYVDSTLEERTTQVLIKTSRPPD